MFNFDAFGWQNYKLTGTVRVSVSDAFSFSDYLSPSYSRLNALLYTNTSNEVPWSSQMIDGVKGVLSTYSQFVNLQFDFKGDYDYIGFDNTPNPEDLGRADLTDINITWINRTDANFSGISGGSTDQRVFGYTGGAGDIFLNSAYLPFNVDLNSSTRQTLIHELGHSLGLSHPHTGYNYSTNTPVISADFAATQFLGFNQLGFSIKSAADMYKEYFTVMAYDDQISSLPGFEGVYSSYTPMILDVIALQQAYGEGSGTSGSGNSTIAPGTGGYRTYFDTGGVDTIDLAAFTDAAYLNMGVTIAGASHWVGVIMSQFDAAYTLPAGGSPANLRWLYGEFENALGSPAGDTIVGNSLDNTIDGLAGNDLLYGMAGNDTLNGGSGVDTAAYNSGLRNYAVAKTASGYTVKDKTSADGTDKLVSIEALKFTDKAINLQIQGQAASVPVADVNRLIELYLAFFNRTPDADGLSYWITNKAAGQTFNQIANAFYSAGQQFSSLTGFTSAMKNSDFVNVVYKNVLGRKDGADAEGMAYWMAKLTDGSASQSSLVSTILDAAHTYKGKAMFGYVADLLDNKIAVSKTVAIDYGINYNNEYDAIANGMAIAAAVTANSTADAIALIGVSASDIQLW